MSYNPATLQPPARNSKRLFRFFAGLCVALAAGCSSVRDTSQTFATVVIDPGHGGKDSGTHSKRGGLEKDNALDVALHVNQDLRRAGFHTVMTRTDDTFIPLNERAAISNEQQNAIFVSIHFKRLAQPRHPRG